MDYVLYGLDDQEVQSQREAATGRFSICLPSEEFIEAYKLFVEIQPEQTQAFQGSTIKFQVKISNRAEEAKRLHLYWGWGLQPPASYWEEVEVPPEGAITREITATLPYLIGDRLVEESISLWIHAFEENGAAPYRSLVNIRTLPCQDLWPYVGSQQKAIRVVDPLVEASVQPDKNLYRKGEEVKLSFLLRNKIAFGYPVDYKIRVWGKDINGRVQTFYTDQGQADLAADVETVLERAFTSGAEAGIGAYYALIEMTHQRWKWTGAGSFALAESGMAAVLQIPEQFLYGETSDVSFNLTCGGKLPAQNGMLALRLVSAQNEELFREAKTVSMAVGETKAVAFSVPMTGLKFGSNRLEYAYTDETGCQFSGRKPVEYKFYLPSASFDKSSYQWAKRPSSILPGAALDRW
ncbi:MAG: hypothetical protein WCB96_12050, partial [Candidatus Aminicenantales bacterium]